MGGNALGYFDCVYQCGQSPRAKAVYFYLKDHADKEGTCWPGINTIAADLSLSRSTVKRALRELVQTGMIEKNRRWRDNGSLTSNLYRIK